MRLLVREPFHIGDTMIKRGEFVPDESFDDVIADPDKARRCTQVTDDDQPQP